MYFLELGIRVVHLNFFGAKDKGTCERKKSILICYCILCRLKWFTVSLNVADLYCRCYVISHLPSLLVLDDHTITAEEREEARKVYGNRRVSVSSKKPSRKHKEKVS